MMLRLSAARRGAGIGLALAGALGLARPALVGAPEFPTLEPSRWIGTPVSLKQLRGRVVLLDVWTFG